MADESWPGIEIDTDLLSHRANFSQELEDPQVRYNLYSLTHNEVGRQGPEAQQAFMESVFNRAAARNMSLGQVITDPKYYPKVSLKPAKLTEQDVNQYDDALTHVTAGSNITKYATGNASGTVGFAGGPQTAEFNGERFGVEGPDAGWHPGVPTGKPVKVEPLKDVSDEVTDVVTLPTKRGKAVHPEDEQWPGTEIQLPEVQQPEVKSVGPEIVAPTPHEDTLGMIDKTMSALNLMGDMPRGSFDDFVKGLDIKSIPKDVAENLTPQLQAGSDLHKTYEMIRDVATGNKSMTEAADAYFGGDLKQFQGIENKPLRERLATGLNTFMQMIFAGKLTGSLMAPPAGKPRAQALPASVDELVAHRVQKPWDNVAINDKGDFIDVPVVRADSGTIGERVSAFLTPAEGARPAAAILLHPGESIPQPLLGYPIVKHEDGSQTLFHPPASDEEWQQVIQSEPDEVLAPDTYEMPTQEELQQPTMTGPEFESYLSDLTRQDQMAQAKESISGGVGTPVMSFIEEIGGLISKTQAKRSGLYKRAGAALWDDVPKDLTGVDMRHLWNGTESPDNVAQALYDDGLIADPSVGTMLDAWKAERDTIQGMKGPKVIPTDETSLPSVMDVRHELESLGITDAERKILAGKHFVVADTVTGDIRNMFGTRQEALDYLEASGKPGEAAFRRDKAGDAMVAKLPDTMETLREREIHKAGKTIGRRPSSGKDWDEYLTKLDKSQEKASAQHELFAPEEQPFSLAGEVATQEASAEGLARREAEAASIQKKAQTTLPLSDAEAKTLASLEKAGNLTKQGQRKLAKLKAKQGIKFKGKGEAGAFTVPPPIEALAKAIRDERARSVLRDHVLAREGATRNVSAEYARQRSNLIRQDFGTIAEADKIGGRVLKRVFKRSEAYKDLEALSAITEAKYDINKLRAHRQLVATSKRPAMAKKWTPVWDRAIRDFNRLTQHPNHLRPELDRQIALEKHNGVNLGYTQDYISHMFHEAKGGFMFGLFGSGSGGGLPRWFTKGRQFPDLATAIHEGEDPKSMNAADLAEARIRAGQRLILYKALHQELQTLKLPDGKTPVAMDKPTRGYETITVQGVPLYVHPEMSGYVATLFDHSAVRRSRTGRAALTVVGAQKAGQLGLDFFHAARLSMYNMGANAGLGRAPRAGMRRGLAVLELPPEAFKQAIASGEYSPAEVEWARKNRPLMIELMAQGAEVAKWGDNISGNLHRNLPGTRMLNTFIFDRLSRGVLMSATIENFKRNLSMYPKLTREQVARKTVIEMNEMFGNLGKKSVFKSRTFQDLSQFLFFARNWFESQAMNEARAYGQMAKYPYNVVEGLVQGMGGKSFGRLGNTARSRLALALGLFAAGEVLNMALNNGKSTFQNEEGHKLHVKIPKGTFGLSKDYYFDPAQVPFELTHQTLKYMHKGESLLHAGFHIATNKVTKAVRGAVAAVTGQTYIGGPVTKPGADRVRQIVSEELPVPIMASGVFEQEPRSNFLFDLTKRPDAFKLQLAASAGIKLEPAETATNQMWQKVEETGFRKPDENTGPGKYSMLKRALNNRDMNAVSDEVGMILREADTRQERAHQFEEIRAALGIRKPSAVMRDPSKPLIGPTRFTGKIADEKKFQRSLNPQDKTLYREAQDEHTAAARYYLILERRLKNQYLH